MGLVTLNYRTQPSALRLRFYLKLRKQFYTRTRQQVTHMLPLIFRYKPYSN
jgi:hypothetical protein